MRHLLGRFGFWSWLYVLLPDYLAYRQKKISRDFFKAKAIKIALAGKRLSDVQLSAQDFAASVLPRLINPAMYRKYTAHKEAGDQLLVISASLAIYLEPWAEPVPVLATRLESLDGVLTGALFGANCWGAEKTRRLAEYLNRPAQKIDDAYGDSEGDFALLTAARNRHYREGRDVFYRLRSAILLISHLV